MATHVDADVAVRGSGCYRGTIRTQVDVVPEVKQGVRRDGPGVEPSAIVMGLRCNDTVKDMVVRVLGEPVQR
ncbi:MAG: hypothetical protein LAT68_14700 [Cyclobacteriaceae bacterium]|nr:hypothetical protein [Cyclobacteriaceae bacterium]